MEVSDGRSCAFLGCTSSHFIPTRAHLHCFAFPPLPPPSASSRRSSLSSIHLLWPTLCWYFRVCRRGVAAVQTRSESCRRCAALRTLARRTSTRRCGGLHERTECKHLHFLQFPAARAHVVLFSLLSFVHAVVSRAFADLVVPQQHRKWPSLSTSTPTWRRSCACRAMASRNTDCRLPPHAHTCLVTRVPPRRAHASAARSREQLYSIHIQQFPPVICGAAALGCVRRA